MAVNLPDPPSIGETGHVSDTALLITAIQRLDEVKVEALTIGTVATGAAGTDVVASITGATTLNLQIPKGDKGATGDKGDKGDDGDKGDTGAGVASGGTTGQILKKKSGTENDTEWGDVAQANVTGLTAALAGKESTGHAAKHADGGSDEITIAPSQVTGTAVVTNDSRLSNSRTPTAHATSHAAAGDDPLSGISASQVSGTAVIESRTITSGGGLTGGGDLSANRTLVVGAGTGITVNADDVALDLTYTDARYVNATELDAQSLLGAITDDTPTAIAVAASRFVGRKATGDVGAMTVAEAKTLLALAVADITGAAPAASPTLTGTVTIPTPAAGSNTTVAASTAFVAAALSLAGMDVALDLAASPDMVNYPMGLASLILPNASSGINQMGSAYLGSNAIHSGGDELPPIQFIDANRTAYRGGNHGVAVWSQAGTALTTADIGKVWAQSTNRITLLDVVGGAARWSTQHNATTTAETVTTAPTGTWTLAANPDVTFGSAPTSVSVYSWDTVTYSEDAWTSGRHPVMRLRYIHRLPSWAAVAVAAQTLNRAVLAADLTTPAVTLTTTLTWYGDQPAVIFIDQSAYLHAATTVTAWGPIQGSSTGAGSARTMIGLIPAHALAGWSTATANTYAFPADWADSIPVSVSMSRNAATGGGAAVGILQTSANRAGLNLASWWTTTPKAYLNAYNNALGSQIAGATLFVRSFHSYSPETSNRHVHVVTDPASGVTKWWAQAGSTGTSNHPNLTRLVGRTVAKTRGTAVVDATVTAAGINVTTAGWAEGTIA